MLRDSPDKRLCSRVSALITLAEPGCSLTAIQDVPVPPILLRSILKKVEALVLV